MSYVLHYFLYLLCICDNYMRWTLHVFKVTNKWMWTELNGTRAASMKSSHWMGYLYFYMKRHLRVDCMWLLSYSDDVRGNDNVRDDRQWLSNNNLLLIAHSTPKISNNNPSKMYHWTYLLGHFTTIDFFIHTAVWVLLYLWYAVSALL